MKFLFPVLLVAIAFTSCKKDYTCVCTNTVTKEVQERQIKERRENDATYKCESASNKPATTVGEFNCTLK